MTTIAVRSGQIEGLDVAGDSTRHPGLVRAWRVKAVVVAADVLTIGIVLASAFTLPPSPPGQNPEGAGGQHFLPGAPSTPGWIAVFSPYRLYTARFIGNRLEEFHRVIHAVG